MASNHYGNVKKLTLQHKFSSKIFCANEISLTRDKELDMYNKKSSMMSPSCYFLLAVESDGIHIGIDGSSCVTSPLFLRLFMPEWFALCILEVTVGSLPPGTWSSPLQKFTKHSASFTKYNDTNTVQQDLNLYKENNNWMVYIFVLTNFQQWVGILSLTANTRRETFYSLRFLDLYYCIQHLP